MVNRTLTEPQLGAKVAHELMHGFLSAYKCAGRCRWLDEATATWAEHFVEPRANTEHEYAKDFFRAPFLSLTHDPTDRDRHKYGAVLVPVLPPASRDERASRKA